MRGHKVVLNIQDTTELDFNGRQSTGLVPLSYEAQRGMYLHPTYAISPEREPLGVLDAWMWAREPKGSNGQRPGIKESLRWVEGYERVAERAKELPEVRQVYVADREADILALLVKARDLGYAADYLVRCQHNRPLPGGDKLWARLERAPVLGSVRFELPAGRGRINRLMRLGRSLPELPADLLFETDEWQAAYILNKKPVPKTVPRLNSVVRLIARMGGFLCRKGDGEPGAKTLWLGLRDVAVFVEGARFARTQL